MKPIFLFSLLFLLVLSAYGWDQADYEIFDLVSELESSEGKGTTFYSFMGVEPTASIAEIGRAYRKKSIQMHPDKNPGVKGVHERFAILGVISTILRTQESRDRYDFFYRNGVPKWRGTGYYYSRFRPGLGTVLFFLVILTTGLQYVVQKLNYKSDLARINMFTTRARLAAWGPKMNPLDGRRKVKVNMARTTETTEDGEEYVTPGKIIEMVVDGPQVYILEADGGLLPLDESAATPPALSRTWLVILARYLYQRLRGWGGSGADDVTGESETDGTDSGTDGAMSKEGGLQGKRMTGGRRRKAAKRR